MRGSVIMYFQCYFTMLSYEVQKSVSQSAKSIRFMQNSG